MRVVRANFPMCLCGPACVLPEFSQMLHIIVAMNEFEMSLWGLGNALLFICLCSMTIHLWVISEVRAKCYCGSTALELNAALHIEALHGYMLSVMLVKLSIPLSVSLSLSSY